MSLAKEDRRVIPDRPHCGALQNARRVDTDQTHAWYIYEMFPVTWQPGMPGKYFHSPMCLIKRVYDNGEVMEIDINDYVRAMKREMSGEAPEEHIVKTREQLEREEVKKEAFRESMGDNGSLLVVGQEQNDNKGRPFRWLTLGGVLKLGRYYAEQKMFYRGIIYYKHHLHSSDAFGFNCELVYWLLFNGCEKVCLQDEKKRVWNIAFSVFNERKYEKQLAEDKQYLVSTKWFDFTDPKEPKSLLEGVENANK